MARKKEGVRRAKPAKMRPEQVRKLWTDIEIGEWLSLLNEVCPEGKWMQSGRCIRGCCPWHDDHNPSMNLNFEGGYGKCFGCGHSFVDIVQLFARLMRKDYSSALVFLESSLHLVDRIGDWTNDLSGYGAHQEMKGHIAVAMRRVVDEWLRNPEDDRLSYMRPACEYLMARGVDLGMLPDLPVGVCARPEHLKNHIPTEFHDAFDAYFANVPARCYGAACFFYENAPGSVSRFRMRKMRIDAMAACGEFPATERIPADVALTLGDKDFHIVADEFFDETPGLFGLRSYARIIGDDVSGREHVRDVWITEGEFDALSVIVEQMRRGCLADGVVLAMGGSTNTGFSFLRDFGVEHVHVVQDSAQKNGGSIIAAILKDDSNFRCEEGTPPTLDFFSWSLPPEAQGADLDELARFSGYDVVREVLFDDSARKFDSILRWVQEECLAEIDAHKAKNAAAPEEMSESDLAEMRQGVARIYSRWRRYLRDDIDRGAMDDVVMNREGLSTGLVDAAIANNVDDSPTGLAIRKIRTELERHIIISYKETSVTGTQKLYMCGRRKRGVHAVPEGNNSLSSIMTSFVGSEYYEHIRNLLGNGSVALYGVKGRTDDEDVVKVDRAINNLTRKAINVMGLDAPEKRSLRQAGAGIHYKNLCQHGEASAIYFVNGVDVYRAGVPDGDDKPLCWEALENCVDDGTEFRINGRRWSSVSSVADLSEDVDLVALYGNLLTVVDGWTFDHHKDIREYLAAWLMSIPIQSAIGNVNLTYVSGESTSGKTSFVSGLLGGYGSRHPVPYILEGANFATDSSEAGMYQTADSSTLPLVLDEAETGKSDMHSERVKRLLSLAFNIPMGGARVSRGSVNPEDRKDYHLNMPMIMASIEMPEDPVFRTRLFELHTKKDVGHRNIGDYLYEKFGPEDFERMRRGVTVGLLRHIPRLERRARELRTLLKNRDAGRVSAAVSDRFVTTLLPALVVYELVGNDPYALYDKLIEHNRTFLESTNYLSEQSELIDEILYTAGIKTMSDGSLSVNVTPFSLISNNSGDYSVLNQSNSGVYFIPERGWIVIVWKEVKHILLKGSPQRYSSKKDQDLRELAVRNNHVMKEVSREDHEFIGHYLGRRDLTSHIMYVVVDKRYIGERMSEASTRPSNDDVQGTEEEGFLDFRV